MDENDLAPFIGRIVLENLSLSKEIEQLRAENETLRDLIQARDPDAAE